VSTRSHHHDVATQKRIKCWLPYRWFGRHLGGLIVCPNCPLSAPFSVLVLESTTHSSSPHSLPPPSSPWLMEGKTCRGAGACPTGPRLSTLPECVVVHSAPPAACLCLLHTNKECAKHIVELQCTHIPSSASASIPHSTAFGCWPRLSAPCFASSTGP
jgi:hypothetical protein